MVTHRKQNPFNGLVRFVDCRFRMVEKKIHASGNVKTYCLTKCSCLDAPSGAIFAFKQYQIFTRYLKSNQLIVLNSYKTKRWMFQISNASLNVVSQVVRHPSRWSPLLFTERWSTISSANLHRKESRTLRPLRVEWLRSFFKGPETIHGFYNVERIRSAY